MIQLFSKIANLLGDAVLQDFMVDTPSNLTSLETPNYLHRLVWVKSEKTFYFLISGNGSSLSHWERYAPSATNFVVPAYMSNRTYGLGSLVHYKSKLYMGLVTPIGQNVYPDINPTKWLSLGSSNGDVDLRAKTFDIPLNFDVNDSNSIITRLSNQGTQSRYQLNHQLSTSKVDVNSYLLTSQSTKAIQISYDVINRDSVIIYLRDTTYPVEPIRINITPISTYTKDAVIVWAGIEQTITDTQIDLEGVVIALDESTLSYAWSKMSGPDVTISTPNSLTTKVLDLISGNTYILRLTATTSDAQNYYNDVTITVL